MGLGRLRSFLPSLRQPTTRLRRIPAAAPLVIAAQRCTAELLEPRLQLSGSTPLPTPPAAAAPDSELAWSTFLGGKASEYGNGIAVDDAGNIYVVGGTESPGLASQGLIDYRGAGDAFVAKLAPDGQLLWSTYLGGTSFDWGIYIVIDPAGNPCITGETFSNAWISGGFDTTYNGGADAFAAKLSPNGQLLWSTYLGGTSDEWGRSIATDPAGNLYVGGTTSSAAWISTGADTTYGGNSDAFIVKLNSDGLFLWSTYVGGSNADWGYILAVDTDANVALTGWTESPAWANAGFDTTYAGNTDAFVAKFAPNGQSLWSTYLGGPGSEDAGPNYGIDFDSANNLYLTGYTQSDAWISGGYDTTLDGDYDGFVVKLAPAGQLLWSTYLGGAGLDSANNLAIDSADNLFVVGGTRSAGWTSAGFDSTYHGGGGQGWSGDAFILKLTPDGQHAWSSFIGGTDDEWANAIAIDPSGNLIITGTTWSSSWTQDGFDTTYNGAQDAFVLKIQNNDSALPTPDRPRLVAGPDPVVNDRRPQITGLALPNLTVKVYIRGQFVGQTTAGPDGTYFFTPAANLLEGSNDFRVRQANNLGNVSKPSLPLNILVIDPVRRVLVLRGSDANDAFNLRQSPGATAVDLFENIPTTADPSFLVPLSAFNSVALIGNAGSDSLTLTGGAFAFNADSNNAPGSIDLTLTDAALSFNSPQHLSSLALNPGSTVQLAPGGSNFLRTNALTIAANASLDLTNNDLVINTLDEQAAIAQSIVLADYIRSTGPGGSAPRLTSSATTPMTTLGDIPNTKGPAAGPVLTTFVGESVDTNTVLVKFTWFGDANLDGLVNSDDYFRIDSGYISRKTGWYNGDFNYDNVINSDDYFRIDSAFIGQTGPLSFPTTPTSPSAPANLLTDPLLATLFSTTPLL